MYKLVGVQSSWCTNWLVYKAVKGSERGRVYDVQGAASGMRSKVALFLEVRDNFSEGLRFYMSLQEAISHLAQQVGDYSMTRQIQR